MNAPHDREFTRTLDRVGERSLRAAALAALTLVVGVAPAAAAEPTKRALTFDVIVGPNDDTPCTVTADLYTPAGASRSRPVPAILATNGFGGSKSDFERARPRLRAPRLRLPRLLGPRLRQQRLQDHARRPRLGRQGGQQLVSFLGGTKAAKDGTRIDFIKKDGPGDPRVGMIGGSYGGQIQFAIAGIDRRLDTIVPQITWNDLSYSLGPNNHDFRSGVTYRTPGVTKIDWPVLFSALGLAQGFQQAVQNQDPSHLGACPNFPDQVCRSLVTTSITGYPDEATLALLRHASVSSYISRIRIPTFLIQGQSDTLFDIQEAVATYRSLRAQRTPVKMLWRSSGPLRRRHRRRERQHQPREGLREPAGAAVVQPLPARHPAQARARLLLPARLGRTTRATPRRPSASRRSYPAGPTDTVFLSGTNQLSSSEVARGGGQRELRGRSPVPAVRAARAIVDPSRARRARHVRVLHQRAARQDHRRRRHPQAEGPPLRADVRADPGREPGRQAHPVREAARRRRRTATPRCRATSSRPCAWRT